MLSALRSFIRNPNQIYFGWYVAIAAMVVTAVTAIARNGFGIFVVPLGDEFGWSRASISVAAGIGFFVNGITQPFLGHLFDKFNSRNVILVSLLVVGITTAVLSLTFHFLFLMFLFGFVLNTALSGASIGTMGPLLARWFVRRRTAAMGLVAAGASLGGLLLIPSGAFIIELMGWRWAWVLFGGIVLTVAGPLCFFFVRNHPSQMGLQPDGDPAPLDGAAAPERRRGLFEVEKWYSSFRSRPIWHLSASYTVCGLTVGLLSVHFVPYAVEEIGVSATNAGLIFGYMMGLNVLGGIGSGIIADRFGRKNVLGTVYFCRGIAYVMLLGGLFAVQQGITLPLIGSPGVISLWVFATIAGFSWLASVPVTTSLTADVYGLRALATINGISFLCHQVGALISIIMAGVLYDQLGSYMLPFAIAGVMLFPAALSAYTINEKKYSSRYATAPVPAGAD